MIYVTSDLHGISLEKLKALLDKVGFADDDFLFVLGDVIDRGEHGAELLRWLSLCPNAELLLGNHEAMMLSCGFLFEEITEDSLSNLSEDNIALLTNWLSNGGDTTLKALRELHKTSPETVIGILDYLKEAPVSETVSAGDNSFLLTHSGIDNFSPDKKLAEYAEEDFLWARPTPQTRYFDDIITVFGHTPTLFFDPAYKGKAFITDTWICVDTGVTAGFSPCLLCLDTLKEYYL